MTPGVEIRKYKPEDFSFLKVLGKGSFGKVIMIISCNYNFYRMICKYLNDVVTNAINTYWNSLVSEVPIINIIFLHKKKVSCVPHKSITLYKACIKILILVKINQNRRDKLIKKKVDAFLSIVPSTTYTKGKVCLWKTVACTFTWEPQPKYQFYNLLANSHLIYTGLLSQ